MLFVLKTLMLHILFGMGRWGDRLMMYIEISDLAAFENPQSWHYTLNEFTSVTLPFLTLQNSTKLTMSGHVLIHPQPKKHVTISTVRGVGSDTNVLCNFRYTSSHRRYSYLSLLCGFDAKILSDLQINGTFHSVLGWYLVPRVCHLPAL